MSQAAMPRKGVLVVEDDPDIRDAMSMALESDGYPVIMAANGREALDRLSRESMPPGLILLDLMMPVMDGWQFLEEVRERDELSAIPIVVVSAYGEKDRHISSAALERRVAFVRKPVDLRLLLRLIEHYCANAS